MRSITMRYKDYKLILFILFWICVSLDAFSQDFKNTFESKLSIDELIKAPVKLIPFPKEVKWQDGKAVIDQVIIADFDKLSHTSKSILNSIFSKKIVDHGTSGYYLKFIKKNLIKPESYNLKVTQKGVEIEFKDQAGQFYAMQTLGQLRSVVNGKISIQLCEISDAPSYAIRGFLLDVGRNFVSLNVLKEQLDIMAKYKLNVFQWHLTDKPAWRIESKKYPQLTRAENHRPTRNPGKYYTYDDIRELMMYAKERQITIIPEIDMPGHSDSFTKAMGFTMESQKGMLALADILNEFFKEIPKELCPMIHLGSDEVRIDNPDEFMSRMIAICQKHQRDVIVWNPGLKIEQDVIRQTWQPKHLEFSGYREIDSWNSYINNCEPMTAVPKLLFKPIGYRSENKVLGGILCLWPDVRLENETDFIVQNPLYPALLTYAWTTWTGDITKTSDRYLTMLPAKGTDAFTYLKTFEDFLLYHKKTYFEGKPFQYAKQTDNNWLLSKPLARDELQSMDKIITQGETIDTSNWEKAVGNTIIIKDRFKQGGYFPKADVGSTVYALSTLNAEQDGTVKAWIGFETPLRANRTYSGIAREGKWDANGGTVWVNGKELPAPEWKNPGWKPLKQSGWGSKEDQEIPWSKEELYWTREPVIVPLKKGSNTIIFKVPSTSDYQNWMFTFAPLEITKKYSQHYYERVAFFENQPDTNGEIIFLGNSITEGGDWKRLFPDENVINRGISGDISQGILDRLDEITASHPKKIFLMIGTNDLARGVSVDTLLMNYEKIICDIQAASHNTELYLQSILPVNPNVGNNFSGHKKNSQKINEANRLIKALAHKYKLVYIDLHKYFKDNQGYLNSKYTSDGLHLNYDGYIFWKKKIKKFVTY